ncbi:MAG: AAA family ATPase [Clostridia bacterium]|nr:AAA family ATPase [Clostridia bacterium]
MIRIITAIGNPNLNNVLKNYEEFDVVGNDILYSDGIIELLENDSMINYLILGEQFNEELESIILKIKELNSQIKIIIIIKNNKEKNNYFKIGVSDIFYEDENIENIIQYLKSKNIEYLNIELRSEIENLKKIVMDSNKEDKRKKIIKKNICIGMVGSAGIGKTTSCIQFAKALNKNNKILIIDFDLNNPQIGNLYNKKIEYSKINEKNFKELIFNVDKNIDILIGLNVLNFYNKINFNDLNNYIKELNKIYDYIFIDTNSEIKNEEHKVVYRAFNYIFIHSGINALETFKTLNLINNLTDKFEFSKEKIRLIYYKINYIELIKSLIKKKNNFNIKKIGIIKNNIFIKENIINENKLINKILIKRIIKNI